jgi:hypothetical protein
VAHAVTDVLHIGFTLCVVSFMGFG